MVARLYFALIDNLIINFQFSIVNCFTHPCHPERSVAESNAERDTKCRDLGRKYFTLTTRDPTVASLGSPVGFDFVRKRTPLKMTRVVLVIFGSKEFNYQLSIFNYQLITPHSSKQPPPTQTNIQKRAVTLSAEQNYTDKKYN